MIDSRTLHLASPSGEQPELVAVDIPTKSGEDRDCRSPTCFGRMPVGEGEKYGG
jgi:hypothetical protein